MQPIKCTQLIANWKNKQTIYDCISSKSLGKMLEKGNLNGIFILGTVGEEFAVILKLEKVPDDMELLLRKDNDKLVNLKTLLSKADIILTEDNEELFELNGTVVSYKVSERTLVFD